MLGVVVIINGRRCFTTFASCFDDVLLEFIVLWIDFYQRPVDPKPPVPRVVFPNSSTSSTSTRATGATTS